MNPSSLFTDALLAYSVHEHQLGHVKRVDMWVHMRSFTIQDDGRGMGLDRPGYVESLMGLLAGRGGEVQLHGVGLAIIAAATPLLTVESRRGTISTFDSSAGSGFNLFVQACFSPTRRRCWQTIAMTGIRIYT